MSKSTFTVTNHTNRGDCEIAHAFIPGQLKSTPSPTAHIHCASLYRFRQPYVIHRREEAAKNLRLCYVLQGQMRLETPEGQWDVPPGYLAAIPCWLPRRWQLQEGERVTLIGLTIHLPSSSRQIQHVSSAVCQAHSLNRLSPICEALYAERQSARPQPAALQRYHELIDHYVFDDLRSISSNLDDNIVTQLDHLWTQVRQNLRNAWPVEKLAESLGVSRTRLFQLCKQYYNLSPKQYVTHLRVRQAKELLVDPEITLESVAALTGYANVYSFSNAFFHQENIRPGAYQKKSRCLSDHS